MRAHPAGPRHAELLADHGVGAPPADWRGLDPAIWPSGVSRDPSSGSLTLHGIDVRALAAEHGTPAMLLDEADVRGRARAYAEAFAGADVYYAGKAFLATAVARWAVEEGLSIDVSSGGELAVALRAGVGGERILFHGNNKSETELDRALEAGVGRYVVDSMEEIARLAFLAERRGVVARGPGPRHGRRRGPHARVHRHRPRGPEVRPVDGRRGGGGGRSPDRQASRAGPGSACTLTSAPRSSTRPGFEVAAGAGRGDSRHGCRADQGVVVREVNLGGGMGIAYVSGDDPIRRGGPWASQLAKHRGLGLVAMRGIPAAPARGRAGARHRGASGGDPVQGGHGQAGGPRARTGAHVRLGWTEA